MSSTRTAVIVLAAGKGARFLGTEHKLAQSLGHATVLGTTLENAIASRLEVIVVTTAALAPLARQSIAARHVVVLPEVGSPGQPGLGMGYSISSGVSASSGASGWLVLPGDMPLVQPETLIAVAAQLGEHPVVYAQHKGRRGHPVGFAAELYTELMTLNGDEGARRLVARYPALAVDVDDAGVLIDIDTVDDLVRLRSAQAAGLRTATAAAP
jgi:molybdenum cofactor cytidylyltransferase